VSFITICILYQHLLLVMTELLGSEFVRICLLKPIKKWLFMKLLALI